MPGSRQPLSWPARDLSRSRRAATGDTVTVVVPRPERPSEPPGDDDATLLLPRKDTGKAGAP